MKRTVLIIILLSFLTGTTAHATHIVGGEMNYEYLGGNDYAIQLTVFRDCYYGVPQFDNPAAVGVYNASGLLVTTKYIPFVDLDTVPLGINDPCMIPPTDVCYEVTQYHAVVNLPPSPGGYTLVYQRCCRNNTIINLDNPGDQGATYMCKIPDQALVVNNSNPVFDAWPPPFICVNEPFVFNQSATDADADSLVYELFNPLHGASTLDPMPQPPYGPPYTNVVWQAPYSPANMLGGIPLAIDSQTGLLTATPNALGQFVVGVKVKEYRAGVYIGETKRDFQVNVTNCPTIIVSSIQVPDVICGDSTAMFTNNSSGAASYYWDFGDPTTSTDNSTVTDPTYTYPGIGTYTAMLVAYDSPGSACVDTSYYTIEVVAQFESDFDFSIGPCSDTAAFIGSSLRPALWEWDFDDGTMGTGMNPTHIYPGSGNYNVVVVVNDTLCDAYDTLTKPLVVNPKLEIDIGDDRFVCDGAVVQELFDAGPDGTQYLWSTGETLQTTWASEFGAYWVWATNDYCEATDTVEVLPAYAIPIVDDSALICQYGTATLVAGASAAAYEWNTGETGKQIEVYDPGVYSYELTSIHGCVSSASIYVEEVEDYSELWIPNSFTPNGDGKNDVFGPVAFGMADYDFTIFDRWGQQLFHSNSEKQMWDGTYPGTAEVAPLGVYVYRLIYEKWCPVNEYLEEYGHVTIVR